MRADEILSWQRLRLEKVDSFRGLYHWRDAMVQRCALRRGLRVGANEVSGRRIVRYG